jgi:hypothetical protein
MRVKSWNIKPFGKFTIEYELVGYVETDKKGMWELMELFVEEASKALYRELRRYLSPLVRKKVYKQIREEVEQRVADRIAKELIKEFKVGNRPVDYVIFNVKGALVYSVRDGESLLDTFRSVFPTRFVGIGQHDFMIIDTLEKEYGLTLD